MANLPVEYRNRPVVATEFGPSVYGRTLIVFGESNLTTADVDALLQLTAEYDHRIEALEARIMALEAELGKRGNDDSSLS